MTAIEGIAQSIELDCCAAYLGRTGSWDTSECR